mgnify:CR=1 FL=1
MTHSRRQKIESMLQDEPDDIFLRYSLALLMEADGEWEASLDILQELARGAPPYVPVSYTHLTLPTILLV